MEIMRNTIAILRYEVIIIKKTAILRNNKIIKSHWEI